MLVLVIQANSEYSSVATDLALRHACTQLQLNLQGFREVICTRQIALQAE